MDLRKLDALVAEKVLGCRVEWQQATVSGPYCGCDCYENGCFSFREGPHSDPNRMDENLYLYSTDIAAAFQVLEKAFPEKVVVFKEFGMWSVSTGQRYPDESFQTLADDPSLPLCICLAALKACGVPLPE